MTSNKLSTANKGEWSEIYALFKIFSEREIAAADANLEPIEGKAYRFIKVFREEAIGNELEYNLEDPKFLVILNSSGKMLKSIDTTKLGDKTLKIFKAIKAADESTFTMHDLAKMMKEYLVKKVKASSQEKTDLLAIIDDRTSINNDKLGFSIKSHIGGAPSLLNPSSQTNFVYEVIGFKGDLRKVNAIQGRSKVRDRLQRIYEDGCSIKFEKIESGSFTNNLRLTDTIFPDILANMILDFYTGNGNNVEELSFKASQKRELGINAQEVEYKVKGFLRSSALGMVPSKDWDTRLSAYGGYIVVLDDGKLLCYSLIKDDDFKDYLFKYTKFDTPSTERYGFGKLYKSDGKIFIKLNLQIRFKK